MDSFFPIDGIERIPFRLFTSGLATLHTEIVSLLL